MRSVYLAGPIAGCDKSEANDWREYLVKRLNPLGIIGVSPLRCEPIIGERYGVGYPEDLKFGTARAISSKNLFDVRQCDMTLAYFPAEVMERKWSIGTLQEIAWARALDKPTIVVTTYEPFLEHPVFQANASWVLPDLDDAVDVLAGVLGVYCHAH